MFVKNAETNISKYDVNTPIVSQSDYVLIMDPKMIRWLSEIQEQANN